jgi:tetratricopeptide (TPR) repeat protein
LRKLLAGLLFLVLTAAHADADDFSICAQNANATLKLAGCSRLIAVKPDFAAAFSSRGVALANLGRLKEAIADYSRAIALDGKLAVAFYNRGLAYLADNQANAAVADFDAAIGLDGTDATALNSRGMANGALGRFDAAEADFAKAIAIDPEYARAYLARATLSLQRGRFAEANLDFDAVLRLHHGDLEALHGRQLADSKVGAQGQDVTGSLTQLGSVPALDPEAAGLAPAAPAWLSRHRRPRHGLGSGLSGLPMADPELKIKLSR